MYLSIILIVGLSPHLSLLCVLTYAFKLYMYQNTLISDLCLCKCMLTQTYAYANICRCKCVFKSYVRFFFIQQMHSRCCLIFRYISDYILRTLFELIDLMNKIFMHYCANIYCVCTYNVFVNLYTYSIVIVSLNTTMVIIIKQIHSLKSLILLRLYNRYCYIYFLLQNDKCLLYISNTFLLYLLYDKSLK